MIRRPKPRIRKGMNGWKCISFVSGFPICGEGDTPTAAYLEWRWCWMCLSFKVREGR